MVRFQAEKLSFLKSTHILKPLYLISMALLQIQCPHTTKRGAQLQQVMVFLWMKTSIILWQEYRPKK